MQARIASGLCGKYKNKHGQKAFPQKAGAFHGGQEMGKKMPPQHGDEELNLHIFPLLYQKKLRFMNGGHSVLGIGWAECILLVYWIGSMIMTNNKRNIKNDICGGGKFVKLKHLLNFRIV
nr:hypothetical protein [bacterium]